MQISQNDEGELIVHDGHAFTSFSYLARAGVELVDTDSVTFSSGHAWVSVAALKTSSPLAADPQWRAGVNRMIDYAQQRGWVDAAGERVRAHITAV